MLKIEGIKVYGCDIYIDTDNVVSAKLAREVLCGIDDDRFRVHSPEHYKAKAKAFLGTD